jgi:hypothetical protein
MLIQSASGLAKARGEDRDRNEVVKVSSEISTICNKLLSGERNKYLYLNGEFLIWDREGYWRPVEPDLIQHHIRMAVPDRNLVPSTVRAVAREAATQSTQVKRRRLTPRR